ncbi:MAG TPA: hypothetical protein VES19_12350, partial [Candidatus Limnocylindrales bacterium]|nr:hypothetical protein [Candidatus Limnocylindrales bacterium]
MSELVYRRVAGGRDPDRDVLRAGADGESRVWRSRGATAGRFETRPEALVRVRAAIAGVAGIEVPAAFAGASPGSDVVAEHLSLDGATLAAPAATAADGPWGELLAACRAAVDDPGEPVAVVAVVAEPPSRVRLEHRGREP